MGIFSSENKVCVAWLHQELAWWLGQNNNKESLQQEYHLLNRSRESVFLFHVSDYDVRIAEKHGTPMQHGALSRYQPYTRRAMYYQEFFQFVVETSKIGGDFTFAIDVEDQPHEIRSAPLLVIQKPFLSRNVLMPDIDFLYDHFYTSQNYHDNIPYTEKKIGAAFSGATTGGGRITLEAVQSLTVPRIRAGMFFLNHLEVDYRLPRIVQCENENVAQAVRDLGIPNTSTTWEEQFSNRFLMSLDGNGATCSRVAIALSSNCVLLKYDSPHRLLYFNSLVPWLHYIPITSDEDVLNVISLEKKEPGRFDYIAKHSQSLSKAILSRETLCDYTGLLLKTLSSVCPKFPEARNAVVLSAEKATQPVCIDFSVFVNVHTKGGLWGWPNGWVGNPGSGLALNGFAIYGRGELNGDDLEYRFIGSDLEPSLWHKSSSICGARGADSLMRGIAVRLVSEKTLSWQVVYQCYFIGGSISEVTADGDNCVSPTEQALVEAIKISIIYKP